MDLDTDDDILRALADGKPMDYAQWPVLLSRLMPRFEKIVEEKFPPVVTRPAPSPPDLDLAPTTPTSASGPSTRDGTANAENAPTTADPIPPPQIQSLIRSITNNLTTLFTTYPPHTIQRLAELLLFPNQHYRTLPSYLHALDRVVHVTSGAHTFPLPPAVPDPSSLSLLSNGTSTGPLTSSADPLSISWGNPATTPVNSTLGSDESLGGALLTPITWLSKNGAGTHSPLEGEVKTESTEMIEGPNGLGGIETVSVSVNGISSATATPVLTPTSSTDSVISDLRAGGGITRGELLRQEQRAGVVPAAQLAIGRGDSDGMGEEDEAPHARGPEEIGMEDMGPQNPNGASTVGQVSGMQGIDVEAAIGRRIDVTADEVSEETVKAEEEEARNVEAAESDVPTTPKREAEEELGGEEKRVKPDSEIEDAHERGVEEEAKQTTEAVIVDADGKTEDEPKAGEGGENKGPDAVDATTTTTTTTTTTV